MRQRAALTLLVLLYAVPASGEDSAQRRYYLDIRYEDLGGGLVKAHDGAGISVGMNATAILAPSSRWMPTISRSGR